MPRSMLSMRCDAWILEKNSKTRPECVSPIFGCVDFRFFSVLSDSSLGYIYKLKSKARVHRPHVTRGAHVFSKPRVSLTRLEHLRVKRIKVLKAVHFQSNFSPIEISSFIMTLMHDGCNSIFVSTILASDQVVRCKNINQKIYKMQV